MTDARLTQTSVEQWASSSPLVQLTQISVEQWASVNFSNPQLALTQIALEQWASVNFLPTTINGPIVTMIGVP